MRIEEPSILNIAFLGPSSSVDDYLRFQRTLDSLLFCYVLDESYKSPISALEVLVSIRILLCKDVMASEVVQNHILARYAVNAIEGLTALRPQVTGDTAHFFCLPPLTN